jgi:hypothetical protein
LRDRDADTGEPLAGIPPLERTLKREGVIDYIAAVTEPVERCAPALLR